MKKLYRCTQCLLTNNKPFMKPAIAFGTISASEVSRGILRHGAWTRCQACQEIASSRRGSGKSPGTQCVDPKGILCAQCNLHRPIDYFDKSAQKNRKVQNKLYCNACKGAVVCQGCRSWRPKTDFRSGADRCKTCQMISCAACGESKSQTHYELWQIRNFLSHKTDVLCSTCHRNDEKKISAQRTHKGEHQRTHHRCGICKEYHNARAFRRTQEGRVNICKSCELVKCKTCTKWLPQSSFTRQSVSLHFQSGQAIRCTTCTAQLTAREKELKLRMQQSKRRRCVCKHPLSHTEKCPMHMRYAGERPYPGCDVMTRDESNFLLYRKQNQYTQKKRKR